MTLKKQLDKLVSKICEREGKKSQVKAGDVREILKIIAELDAERCSKYEPGALVTLLLYSYKIEQKMKKKAKKK